VHPVAAVHAGEPAVAVVTVPAALVPLTVHGPGPVRVPVPLLRGGSVVEHQRDRGQAAEHEDRGGDREADEGSHEDLRSPDSGRRCKK